MLQLQLLQQNLQWNQISLQSFDYIFKLIILQRSLQHKYIPLQIKLCNEIIATELFSVAITLRIIQSKQKRHRLSIQNNIFPSSKTMSFWSMEIFIPAFKMTSFWILSIIKNPQTERRHFVSAGLSRIIFFSQDQNDVFSVGF